LREALRDALLERRAPLSPKAAGIGDDASNLNDDAHDIFI
jgi:hypothetical protein